METTCIYWHDLLGAVHTMTRTGNNRTIEHNTAALELYADIKRGHQMTEIDRESERAEYGYAADLLGFRGNQPAHIYRISRRRRPHRTAGYLCLKRDFPKKENDDNQ